MCILKYSCFLIYIDAFIIDLQYHGENYNMFTSEWTILYNTTKKSKQTWRGFCIQKMHIWMYSSHKKMKRLEEEISYSWLWEIWVAHLVIVSHFNQFLFKFSCMVFEFNWLSWWDIKHWFLLLWKLCLKEFLLNWQKLLCDLIVNRH